MAMNYVHGGMNQTCAFIIGMFVTLSLFLPLRMGLAQRQSPIDTPKVSLISLIATPEKFDGMYVRISGTAYFDSRHYTNCIYLTKEDKRHGNDANALFVEFSSSIKRPDRLNDEFVSLQGVFRANDHGRFGWFPGSLVDVDRAIVIPGIVK
jgi:hypothetical protein